MPLTVDKIETMAPDQASLAAAAKIKASSWPVLLQNSGGQLAWGECQGSGSAPYRVSLALDDFGYKCTCPSRKFPCKHTLSLMLLYVQAAQNFGEAAAPDWVADWAGRRRPKPVEKEVPSGRPRASLDAIAEDETPNDTDEKALARAAQQRQRLKAEREASILLGLDELDQWISDRLNRGLAGFMNEAGQQCRLVAQRLVDAKAPALAAKLDSLPSELLALPERIRADAAVEVLGSLHLLAQAYRRRDQLPEALAHDVNRLVGWTQERQSLLADPAVQRASGDWMVIATHIEVQPDKLRRIETWLARANDDLPRYAVLIDFVPVSTGAQGSAYAPGEMFAAELAFYPSAAPLRALIATRGDAQSNISVPAIGRLAQALDDYEALRACQPWLGQWPMTMRGVDLARFATDGLWLVDGDDGIPLHPRQLDDALALADARLEDITGLWDGRYFTAVMANTSLGRWVRQ